MITLKKFPNGSGSKENVDQACPILEQTREESCEIPDSSVITHYENCVFYYGDIHQTLPANPAVVPYYEKPEEKEDK